MAGGSVPGGVGGLVPDVAEGQYPVQQDGQYPVQKDGQYPVWWEGQYPVQKDGQYPVWWEGQYPVQKDGQYPLRREGQYPVRWGVGTRCRKEPCRCYNLQRVEQVRVRGLWTSWKRNLTWAAQGHRGMPARYTWPFEERKAVVRKRTEWSDKGMSEFSSPISPISCLSFTCPAVFRRAQVPQVCSFAEFPRGVQQAQCIRFVFCVFRAVRIQQVNARRKKNRHFHMNCTSADVFCTSRVI